MSIKLKLNTALKQPAGLKTLIEMGRAERIKTEGTIVGCYLISVEHVWFLYFKPNVVPSLINIVELGGHIKHEDALYVGKQLCELMAIQCDSHRMRGAANARSEMRKVLGL